MKILIFSLRNWMGIARLPYALKSAGFEVGVICPNDSFISKTKFSVKSWTYEYGSSNESLANLIEQASEEIKPTLIIPGDDPSATFLGNLIRRPLGKLSSNTQEILKNSLCENTLQHLLEKKSELKAIASMYKIRAPAQLISPTLEQAEKFIAEYGLPVTLKLDHSFAGEGVSICKSTIELEKNYQIYKAKALTNGATFVIQQYIKGIPASTSFSALKGELLASFAFEAESTISKTGFTTIIRSIENQEMLEAAQKLSQYFVYNGFGGLDFIIDDVGQAWLLEINNRPTQTCHLGGVLGHDLCIPLFSKLSKSSPHRDPSINRYQRIALFPNAWEQNIEDLQNFEGLVDVPWKDPELLAKIISYSWQNVAR